MSGNIEERVLSMRFDNSNFESNVSQTMSTLDKLKSALKFTGIEDGFSKISSAASSVDMSTMGSAVETVSSKFSALEVIAVTALANITTQAVNTAESLIKSLTIDQITAGFDKYEQKMEAVQTIMSATTTTWEEDAANMGYTGTQMEYVSTCLDKLNWFSDETSYSFTDMTSNIGKFTAAGQNLTDSVEAMEGISVWAAKSGQNAQGASRAYYNLAQAMSVGQVKLIDWRSIENANMATVEFKQTAIDTAEALGTLTKSGEDTWTTLEGNEVTVTNFNDALSDGWFSADVLMSTLKEYGKATTELSNYCNENDVATTQLLNTLDRYNESVEEGTDKTTALQKASKELGVESEDLGELFEKLNSEEYELSLSAFRAAQQCKTFKDVVEATKDAVSTQWMNTFEYFFGNYEQGVKFWSELCERFWDLFAASGDVRNSILELWSADGGRDDFINGIWNLWDAFDQLNDPVFSALEEHFPKLASYLEGDYEHVSEMADGLKNLTENFETLGDRLVDSVLPAMEQLEPAFDGVFALVEAGKNIVQKAFWDTTALIKIWFYELTRTDTFSSIFVPFEKFAEKIRLITVAIKSSQTIIPTILHGFLWLGYDLIDLVKSIGNAFSSLFEIMFGKSVTDAIDNFYNKLIQFLYRGDDSGIENFFNRIHDLFSSLIKLFDDVAEGFDKVNSGAKKLKDGSWGSVAQSFGNFIKAIFESFNSMKGDFLPFLEQLGKTVSSLFDTLAKGIKRFDLKGILGALASGSIIVFISSLGNSLKKLKEAIGQFKIGAVLKSIFTNLSEFSFGDQLKRVAESILILAAALWLLSTVPADDLWNAVGALSTISGIVLGIFEASNAIASTKESVEEATGLAGKIGGVFKTLRNTIRNVGNFFKTLSAMTTIVGSAVALYIAAKAIGVLADSIKKFEDVDWASIGKAGSAFGGLSLIFGLFSKFGGSGINKLLSSGSLALAAQSIASLADSCSRFNNVNWESLGKAGAAEAGLAVIIGFMNQLGGNGIGQLMASGSLATASEAMIDLAKGIRAFGHVDWESIGKAGSAEAGLAVIISLMNKLGGNGIGQLMAGGALSEVSESMESLAKGIKIFGEIDWKAIGEAGSAEAGIAVIVAVLGKIAGLKGILGGVSLSEAGSGMKDLADGIVTFNRIDWDSMAKAGVAATALGLVVGLLGKLAGFSGLLGGGALALAATGLLLLAKAMQAFMNIEWNTKGIIGAVASIAALIAICAGLSAAWAIILPGAAVLAAVGAAAWVLGLGLAAVSVALKGFVDVIVAAITGVQEIVDNFLHELGKVVDWVIEKFQSLKIGDLLGGIWDTISSWGSQKLEAIGAWIDGIVDSVKSKVAGVKDFFSGLFGGGDDDDMTTTETVEFSAEAIAAMEELKTKASEAQQAVRDIGTELLTLDEQFATFGSSTQAIATSMMDITNYCNIGIVALTNLGQQGSFAGQLLVAGLAAGVSQCGAVLMLLPSQGASAMAIFNTTIAAGVNATGTQLNRMGPLAAAAVAKFIAALNSGAAKAYTAGESMGLAAVRGITATASSSAAYQCGANVGQGLINGLNSKATAAYLAGVNLGSAAIRGTNAGSGTASPSKLTFQTGIWDGEGLVNGMKAMEKKVHNAGYNLGQVSTSAINESVKGVGDTISNVNPTITPVLDLSNVNSGLDGLSGRTLNLSGVAAAAAGLLQNGGSSAGGYSNTDNSQVINFYQTNNSPKALSRTAIYRQTKNQLNRIRK